MRRIASVYIAGPDAVFEGGPALLARKRLLCESVGFVPVMANDSVLVETEPSEAMAREIYMDRIARMRMADAAIVNLTPWRGPSCEPDAAFEAGFLAALGKPVFGYLNVDSERQSDYRTRVEELVGGEPDIDGRPRDAYGCEIEDFGLPENLMLWAEARRLFVVITPDLFADLTGFEMCLDAVRLYAD